MELFSLLATLCLTCVVSSCVIFRGGLPLYLYMKERRCCGYAWREAHAPLPSTWRHATTTWRRGQAAPVGGWPSLDHCLWPPPSRGRPWARPTLLPSGVLLRLSWIDRRLCHSFTWFSVEKRISVNFSCILCLLPTKHACTKTCGKCELKSLILSLVFIWAYFI
jgi:hypothetical protein